jgi:hypothetical protein
VPGIQLAKAIPSTGRSLSPSWAQRLARAFFYPRKGITMFDIAKLASADTATLHLNDQKEVPLYAKLADGNDDLDKPLTITLYGPGSRVWKNAEHKASQATNAKAFAAMRGKADTTTAEESQAQIAARWAACTVSLNNFQHAGGAKGLYAQTNLGYILDQVAKFANDWANFPSVATTI